MANVIVIYSLPVARKLTVAKQINDYFRLK